MNNLPIAYSPQAIARAKNALWSAPFQWRLFAAMGRGSVPLGEIVGQRGITKGYSDRPLSENQADQELMWLTKVGLLRREVDGQGITDGFRLTPLGNQLIQPWGQNQTFPRATWGQRIANRWQRLTHISLV